MKCFLSIQFKTYYRTLLLRLLTECRMKQMKSLMISQQMRVYNYVFRSSLQWCLEDNHVPGSNQGQISAYYLAIIQYLNIYTNISNRIMNNNSAIWLQLRLLHPWFPVTSMTLIIIVIVVVLMLVLWEQSTNKVSKLANKSIWLHFYPRSFPLFILF